ncbi:MAG: N-acetyltransferase [Candidatus Electrothrix sp. AR1]|nr:N-acetyltransferase [Candidatus Electrothrix sp. AR1]
MLATPNKVLSLKVRKSTESERKEILNIHSHAFGKDKGSVIAQLVHDLFDDETAIPRLSLVAVENDKLVGHVLFTKVVVTEAEKLLSAQILAPLAILPEEQKKGIGEQLINEGLRLLQEAGTELVFVLGHPAYYPRCGFIPAGAQGFDAPYPIPEEHAEAWMVQELRDGVLKQYAGRVQCSEVLNEPQHWRE